MVQNATDLFKIVNLNQMSEAVGSVKMYRTR